MGPSFVRRHRSRWLAAAIALALTGFAFTTAVTPSRAATQTVHVSVNADEGLGTVPDTAYGANQAVWDANMNTPASVNLLSQAGVAMMRYPGGSYGDGYHWQTNTVTGGGYGLRRGAGIAAPRSRGGGLETEDFARALELMRPLFAELTGSAADTSITPVPEAFHLD